MGFCSSILHCRVALGLVGNSVTLLIGSLLLIAGTLSAADLNAHLITNCALSFTAKDVARVGNLAYVVGGKLSIIDTANPANPREIGTTPVAGLRVKIVDNYAYVAAGQGGLQVFDVGIPASPRKTSTIPTTSSAYDVALSGDYAFVAEFEAGLRVLSITNRAVPRSLGRFFARSGDFIYGVCISSNNAFLLRNPYPWPAGASYYEGVIEALDISNPAVPQYLSTYLAGGGVNHATVRGDYLYLAKNLLHRDDKGRPWWSGALEILDISDPSSLQRASLYETSGRALDITLAGDLAYVVCGDDYAEQGPYKTVLQGQNGVRGINVVDVSDPTHPRGVGGYHRSWLQGIAVTGGLAYAAGLFAGLQILDVNSPANVVRVAQLDTSGHAYGLAAAGSHLVVADCLDGLQIVDIAKPTSPELTATVTLGTEPVMAVACSGNTVFAAAGQEGLYAFDLIDPANPHQLSVYDTPGQAQGVTLSGNHAYVADGEAGLQIVDVSDPGNPQLVGSLDTAGFANSVVVTGGYALVADWQNGLLVIDVDNPGNPHLVGSYNGGGYTLCTAVTGSKAFIADGTGGFQVLDISDPANPRLFGSAPGEGWARSITVSGRFAYVADAFAGIQVYDISDLARPRRIGGTTALDTYGLLASGGRLFAAGGKDGLGVFDLFTPPLNVEAASNAGAGSINLRVDGPPGAIVRIQRSTDLSSWGDWKTVTLGEVPLAVTDTNTASAPRGFYRAVSP